QLLGAPAEALLGRNYREFVHPDDLERSVEANRQRLLGELPDGGAPMHRRVSRGDGSYFEAEVNTGPMFGPDGGVVGVLGIMRDVSERQRIVRELARSEERYRTLVDYAPDAIYTLTPDGGVHSVNRAFETLTGFTVQDALRRHFLEFVHPGDVPRARSFNQETMRGATGAKGSIRLARADGSYVEVDVTSGPLQNSDGFTAGVLGILRDVTEARRAAAEEAKLADAVRATAQDWMLTFDAVSIGLVVLDAKGAIHRLNEAARQLSGREFGDLIGRPLSWLGGDDPWAPAAQLAADTVRGAVSRSRTIDRGAGRRAWSLTAHRYSAPDGERVIVTIRDVTESFELQRAAQRAETMAALGVLVAGVAHEVRNPLFAISATLDAFEARFGQDEAYRLWAAPLRPEVERLSQLMRDLLEYGRPAELQREATDVGAVLTAARDRTRANADQRQVQVVVDIAPELPAIQADPGRLLQVFQNLIDNAVRHAPEGSVVEAALEWRPGPGGGQLHCEVRDRGPGFAAADLERVFEPFFSRRRGGTGLGLSIVQRLVEQHHGTITASNQDGGGGLVTVMIPVSAV
ncbi:MAG: PAS domain-containing sensor histidine kinase, partial [Gemmatimonadales bacterium]